jgi:glucose/arabinose dehydrogenase
MDNKNVNKKVNICSQSENGRYLNPSDINISPGYAIEVFAEGLNSPSSILFTNEGEMYLADTGYTSYNPNISRLVDGRFEVIADGFNVPLIGINYRDGNIYASHRGTITVIRRDGTRQDILSGLPSYGDYSNSKVAFGPDNKIYFGQGTATNSGVVGEDNLWVVDYPFFHDYPGSYIMLNGQNYVTRNLFANLSDGTVLTGAFSPFGVPNQPYEVRKGVLRASGSILRSNFNGEELELVAWGLRSISYVKFDTANRLFVSNNGCDIRGSRPIANAPDEFHIITPGTWYGWPDYVGGEPVTNNRFAPEGGRQPEFLLTNHPNIPPRPYVAFPPESTIIGFDFNNNSSFGRIGDIYIAEFGSILPRTYGGLVPQYTGVGHRISKIDINTGGVSTFAINKSGFSASITREGGFGRPADIAFGPDGAMYVVDMGINTREDPNVFLPESGVIWRITRI